MSSNTVKILNCNGIDIPFRLIKKNNKHTYFYFNEPGIVKVHLAKGAKIQPLLHYIKRNQPKFKQRFLKAQPQEKDPNAYFLYGLKYQRKQHDGNDVIVDDTNATIAIPNDKTLQTFERALMEQAIIKFEKKYETNGFVSLDNITYKVSYMTSRYGSCHKHKRKIHLNMQLLHEDPIFLEYVFCHEICHLKIDNHSKSFYTLLSNIFPNYKRVRKQLKQISLR